MDTSGFLLVLRIANKDWDQGIEQTCTEQSHTEYRLRVGVSGTLAASESIISKAHGEVCGGCERHTNT